MLDRADPTLARLMLSELPRAGEQALIRVLTLARDEQLALADVLKLAPSLLAARCRLPAVAIERLTIDIEAYTHHCQALLTRLRRIGAELRTSDDAGYPRPWRQHAIPPPPLVYVLGTDAALAAPTIAILSSRTITTRSVTATIRVVEQAAAEGFTLVTGGMKSTHRIAALAARTIAAVRVIVLDRGLSATFPGDIPQDSFGVGPCRPPLDLTRTLVLSPFRLNDHAVPRNGRRRDHLMAALADVVVAVSARPGGEIERVCLQALDRGQCVLSWQGANPGLVVAGATLIDDGDLRAGLTRLLPKQAAHEPTDGIGAACFRKRAARKG